MNVYSPGANSPIFTYTLIGSQLAAIDQKRDLRVVVVSSMKMSTQCTAAVKKTDLILSIIRTGIEDKTILPLYKSVARWH